MSKVLNETERKEFLTRLISDSRAVSEVRDELLGVGSEVIQKGGETRKDYIAKLTHRVVDILEPVFQPLVDNKEVTLPELIVVLGLIQMNITRSVIMNGTVEVSVPEKGEDDATGRANSTGTTQFVN